MPRMRRTFTDEFKREAVKLVKQPGAKVTTLQGTLASSRARCAAGLTVLDMRPNRPLRSEAASEVERLQRELRRGQVTGPSPWPMRSREPWRRCLLSCGNY